MNNEKIRFDFSNNQFLVLEGLVFFLSALCHSESQY